MKRDPLLKKRYPRQRNEYLFPNRIGKIIGNFAKPVTNISGSWPTAQRTLFRHHLLLPASGATQLIQATTDPRATHREITVIKIVGTGPTLFIQEIFFLSFALRANFCPRCRSQKNGKKKKKKNSLCSGKKKREKEERCQRLIILGDNSRSVRAFEKPGRTRRGRGYPMVNFLKNYVLILFICSLSLGLRNNYNVLLLNFIRSVKKKRKKSV